MYSILWIFVFEFFWSCFSSAQNVQEYSHNDDNYEDDTDNNNHYEKPIWNKDQMISLQSIYYM